MTGRTVCSPVIGRHAGIVLGLEGLAVSAELTS
jgi:hypothetical protein